MAMFHVIFSIHHLTAYLAQFPLKCLSRNATYESDRNLAFLRFQRNVSLQTDVSFLLAQSWNRFPCKPQRLSSTFTLNIDTNPTARLQVVTLTETDGTRASRRVERHSEKKDAWAGEGFPLWSRSTGGKQKLGCLTLKCPLLHTAVKNSVWTSGAQLNITTQAFLQQQRQDYHDNIRTSVRKRLPPQASEAALLLLRTGLWEKTVGNDTVYDSKTKNLEKVQMTGSETLDVCVEKFNQFRSGAHMRYRA